MRDKEVAHHGSLSLYTHEVAEAGPEAVHAPPPARRAETASLGKRADESSLVSVETERLPRLKWVDRFSTALGSSGVSRRWDL
jgi:hypothetical protein